MSQRSFFHHAENYKNNMHIIKNKDHSVFPSILFLFFITSFLVTLSILKAFKITFSK